MTFPSTKNTLEIMREKLNRVFWVALAYVDDDSSIFIFRCTVPLRHRAERHFRIMINLLSYPHLYQLLWFVSSWWWLNIKFDFFLSVKLSLSGLSSVEGVLWWTCVFIQFSLLQALTGEMRRPRMVFIHVYFTLPLLLVSLCICVSAVTCVEHCLLNYDCKKNISF